MNCDINIPLVEQASDAELCQHELRALKFERPFIATMVDKPESMTIVSTIVYLAHELKLIVAPVTSTRLQRTISIDCATPR